MADESQPGVPRRVGPVPNRIHGRRHLGAPKGLICLGRLSRRPAGSVIASDEQSNTRSDPAPDNATSGPLRVDCRLCYMEALVERHFGVEFGNEIRTDFQCLTGASLGEFGEEFAAFRIACLDQCDRLTLDVGELFGPTLL